MSNILYEKYAYLLDELKIDCKNCSGLCCVALYCSKTDGFPADKVAGVPCKNILPDFKCKIHNDLKKKKMKGCLTYECFGAGQKVTQKIYSNKTWDDECTDNQQIFDVFVCVFELHQMLWYLLQALRVCNEQDKSIIEELILENMQITSKNAEYIISFDMQKYRNKVNKVLKSIILYYDKYKDNKSNYIGKNFKNSNLDNKNFCMSLLIRTNLENCSLNNTSFLGCDMRDTNIKNADLSNSMFLTQMQINSAIGNTNTKLPDYIKRPKTW